MQVTHYIWAQDMRHATPALVHLFILFGDASVRTDLCDSFYDVHAI